jgi:hypothetical protein
LISSITKPLAVVVTDMNTPFQDTKNAARIQRAAQ